MTKSRKKEFDKGVKHIMLYGLALATLIFGLKWLQWNFLVVDNAIDLYIGLIAVIFTMLGMWVASQLIKSKTQTVFEEKQVIIHQSESFILNQTELKRLSLTNREHQVLKLIVQGFSNAEIADQLFLSLSTIKTHVSSLYVKMNVKNRFQAMTKAKRMKIVE